MSIRLAVFDCDGTLSDGQAAVCEAMDIAFAEAGLPAPDRNRVRRIVGLSLHRAIPQLLPQESEERCADIVENYKTAFRQARLDGSLHEPLYDGIPELLRTLKSRGWLLGVATGKSYRGLKSTLATHGIGDLFQTLQTADSFPSKPHPAMLEAALDDTLARPENAVMIGDTVYDIEMARSIGVRALGVAWGYHEPEELLKAGAQAIAATPADLENLING
ncbi:HAD-IA family hydrolase [Altericroceibacterium endophyticum]|uniref:HAD-IA family hydrolase n=1 Tax=Altericroceibacterium endophyticum TaxID=1808508 RepID=A0A6I4T6S4_9SPHN|nr:HAD-IA family hydrolase [Altericroceibacterium endophyticum]MXO66527.1 HAD-IA family hydrolase [Altericroceibacterium endophyticum]